MEQAAAAALRAREAEALLAASGATTQQASQSFYSQLAAERAAAQERQRQLEGQAAAQAAAEQEGRRRAEAQLAAEQEARQRSEGSLAAQLAERDGQLAAMAAELARLRAQQAQQGQLLVPSSAETAKGELAALRQASLKAGVSELHQAKCQPNFLPSASPAAATGARGSTEWGATASREAEPALGLPGSTVAGAEPEAAAWSGSLAGAAAAAGGGATAAGGAEAAAEGTPAPGKVPVPPGQMPCPDLLSPAASCGTREGDASAAQHLASRRRLTTGRSSGGARRRLLRSRPAPAGPGSSGAALTLPAGQAGQQAQQGSGSVDNPASGRSPGAGPASEDWGRMFGMLSAGGGASGSAADGVGVGDSAQLPAGRTSMVAAGRSAHSSRSSPPASPGLSLDGVAPHAAGDGGGGIAPQRHGLGAALRRALGSQESRSQGPAGVMLPPPAEQLQAQHAQQARQAQQQVQHQCPHWAPSPAAPAAAADAVAHLAAMQLDELLALPTAGSPGLARPDSATSAGQGMGDLEAAMAAAADIAQYLAD